MDIFYYIVSPVAILVSAGVGFYAGRTGQRRSELEVRMRELEDTVWQFARIAAEYWSLEPQDDRLSGHQIAMKNLSTRIGRSIKHLNSHYRDFCLDNNSYLLVLRQAAMSSPFEGSGRQIDLKREDYILQAADRLIREILIARRSFLKRLTGNHFSVF